MILVFSTSYGHTILQHEKYDLHSSPKLTGLVLQKEFTQLAMSFLT